MPSVRDIGVPSLCWNRCSSAAAGVVVHQEGAAADAGRLRLDQGQHHLHGDRRVDRRAALLEHLVSGIDRQRIGGRDHVLARRPAGLVGIPGGDFGRALGGLLGVCGEYERRGGQHRKGAGKGEQLRLDHGLSG
jgi:hypothetical protein